MTQTIPKKLPSWLAGILAWLIPGLGHFVLGDRKRALIVFGTVTTLFFSGLALSGKWSLVANQQMGFDIRIRGIGLSSDVLGPLAAVPESFNGLATIFSYGSLDFDSFGQPRLEPAVLVAGLTIGMILSAMAGILNLIAIADVVLIAGDRSGRLTGPSKKRDPFFAVLLSWLLPGAGHLYAGYRTKGLFLGALVLGTFIAGVILGQGCDIDRQRFPYYFLATIFLGLPTLIGGVATEGIRVDESVDPRLLEVGLLFVAVAGLMNLLVMIDALNRVEVVNFADDEIPVADSATPTVARKT